MASGDEGASPSGEPAMVGRAAAPGGRGGGDLGLAKGTLSGRFWRMEPPDCTAPGRLLAPRRRILSARSTPKISLSLSVSYFNRIKMSTFKGRKSNTRLKLLMRLKRFPCSYIETIFVLKRTSIFEVYVGITIMLCLKRKDLKNNEKINN